MKQKLFSGAFLTFTLVYIVLTVILPTDPAVLARYHITQSRAHMLGLTIAVPIVLIWLFALYGFLKFQEYTVAIQESPEGQSFRYLSHGLMVLIFSLPLLSSVSSVFTYLGYRNSSLIPMLTIIKNYTNLFFPFIAFLLLAKGADGLIKTLHTKSSARTIPKMSLLLSIVLASLYTWLITTRPIGPSGDTAYYLPNALIIITLAIPYLYIWCKGAAAAYQLYIFKTKVKGTIYRQALNSVAFGIAAIIFLSIFLQMIVTLSVRLTSLHLSPLLTLIYILVLLTGIGYGLLARGAKKLKQIEEV